MYKYIYSCKNINYSWFTITEQFGYLAKSIYLKDKALIEKNMITLIATLFKISYENNLDMKNAWDQWCSKAISKHYD